MGSDSKKTVRQQASEHNHVLSGKLDHSPWGRPTVPYNQAPPKFQDPEAFANDLVSYIQTQSEADVSPFYEYLLAGKIPREAVKEWVKQLYFDARGFPVLIAQLVANCPYQYDIRQLYGVNLAEELGEFNPLNEHPVLLMRLGRALGLKDEEMEFVEPFPELLLYVEYRHKLVRDGSFLEAVAAGSLAIESTIVQRYRKIVTAMKTHYGVTNDDDLEYFYIHSGGRSAVDYGGDVAHAGEAMSIIKKYATTADLQERCRQAVWRSIEARKVYQWGLFRHLILKNETWYQDLIKGKSQLRKSA